MVKSPKTGAYVFDEQMVPNGDVRTSSRSKILYLVDIVEVTSIMVFISYIQLHTSQKFNMSNN
jgi:hypothetical protein